MLTPLHKTGTIYSIPCKDCNSVYIDEIGHTCIIHLAQHKCAYKSKKLQSKLVQYSLDTDYTPDFASIIVIRSSCNNIRSRIFLEGWFTRSQNSLINESYAIPPEYTALL